ncbi:hypothetical protein TrST_g10776 [Triparma strigata]|uniref:Uncharacterized protein n=1 Tax=Triparma strigata TaxID=1606541 RepID=A0A9W7C4H9_9STRA|nr:hypothetical protein TrST_g10776 [Triparma strigata]
MGKITSADKSDIVYEHYEGADYLSGGVDAFVTLGGSSENEFNVADDASQNVFPGGATSSAFDLHFTAFGVDSLSDLVRKDMECKEDVVFVDGVPDFDLDPKASVRPGLSLQWQRGFLLNEY